MKLNVGNCHINGKESMNIKDLIKEGCELLSIEDYKTIKIAWYLWLEKINDYFDKEDISKDIISKLRVKMHFVENEYSQMESKKALRSAVEEILCFLNVEIGKEDAGAGRGKEDVSWVIENVLKNFHLYVHAMYQTAVHGKGTLSQEILQQIKIGNEYDVQRMLYALLLPIFPELRMEVNKDNGYSGMRADLYLDNYDLIIEIKCTRSSMTEKRLTEELGADAFHYRSKKLYIFIYDKERLIANTEAYKTAFRREYEKDGKTVEMYINQPIQL